MAKYFKCYIFGLVSYLHFLQWFYNTGQVLHGVHESPQLLKSHSPALAVAEELCAAALTLLDVCEDSVEALKQLIIGELLVCCLFFQDL